MMPSGTPYTSSNPAPARQSSTQQHSSIDDIVNKDQNKPPSDSEQPPKEPADSTYESLRRVSISDTIGDDSTYDTQRPDSAGETIDSSSAPETNRYVNSSGTIAADDFEDEAYAESTTSADLTSLASDVRRGIVENGRVYPNYGRHDYGMPMDEQELDRNDLQHAKFTLLQNNQLFLAPITEAPTRILDIGTGTGIWAIDIGDVYPSAEVIGTDIAPVQPTWIPPNVQFIVEDAEDNWTFSPETFDFVFSRETSFAVRDWPRFISQAHTTLKPGGWLELSATYPKTHCDDGSLDLKTSYFVQTVDAYYEMAEIMGASLEAPLTWAKDMREAGYVDVEQHFIKIPMGPWAKDKRLKKIGLLERAQLEQGYEAYMMRGWTQVLKKPAAELHVLIAEGRKEINNPKFHTYAHFIVVTGRKPDQ